MVVAGTIGLVGGLAAGLTYGYTKYYKVDPVHDPESVKSSYDALRSMPEVDPDDKEQVKAITELQNKVAPFLPAWVRGSDFQRVNWLNQAVRAMFPHYNTAISEIVIASVEPILKGLMPSFVDEVKFDEFDFGEMPFTLGGVRLYDTDLDEVSFDTQLNWGGGCRVVLGIYAKGLHIQLEVSDIQICGLTRVTLGPLVDIIPCLGAVTISMLGEPETDLVVRPLGGADLLAIPGVAGAVKAALNQFVYCKLGEPNWGLVYPNMMTFDIMDNGGREKKPKGLLKVKLIEASDLKNQSTIGTSDPYAELMVLGGTASKYGVKSKCIDSNLNPKYDEEFDLLITDLELDHCRIVFYDEDILQLGNDDEMGRVMIPVADLKPREPVTAWYDLVAPVQQKSIIADPTQVVTGSAKLVGKGMKMLASPLVGGSSKKEKKYGRVKVTMEYRPFVDEKPKKSAEGMSPKAGAGEVGGAGAGAGAGKINTDGMQEKSRDFHFKPEMAQISQNPMTKSNLGVLRIKLVGAGNLVNKGLDGSSDPFVVFTCEGKTRKSTVKADENSPYWNESFEFVALKDSSYLKVNVFSKPGNLDKLAGGLKNLKGTLQGKIGEPDKLGDLSLPLAYIAKNRRVKERFPLHHTKSGDITLALTWTYFR